MGFKAWLVLTNCLLSGLQLGCVVIPEILAINNVCIGYAVRRA